MGFRRSGVGFWGSGVRAKEGPELSLESVLNPKPCVRKGAYYTARVRALFQSACAVLRAPFLMWIWQFPMNWRAPI